MKVQDGMQYGDLIEFCDFAFMERVARVNGATLWTLAQAPGTPTGAKILTEELTNSTELV